MTQLSRLIPLLAVAALIAAAWAVATHAPATAQTSEPTLVVDVGPEGTPTDPGEIEDCVSVAVGDRFQIDMVIQDVADLLAWEAPLDFDPEVVIVVDHDVKQFQSANTGSSVIDISAKLPDNSGFHMLSAFESSDPPRADSGSGVLARVTLEAIAEGESALAFGDLDINDDGSSDRGVLLRNLDADVIGDDDGDLIFDGERADALVVVGGDCPEGSNEYVAADTTSEDDDSSPLPYIGAGVGVVVVLLGLIGVAVVMSRGSRRKPDEPTEAQP